MNSTIAAIARATSSRYPVDHRWCIAARHTRRSTTAVTTPPQRRDGSGADRPAQQTSRVLGRGSKGVHGRPMPSSRFSRGRSTAHALLPLGSSGGRSVSVVSGSWQPVLGALARPVRRVRAGRRELLRGPGRLRVGVRPDRAAAGHRGSAASSARPAARSDHRCELAPLGPLSLVEARAEDRGHELPDPLPCSLASSRSTFVPRPIPSAPEYRRSRLGRRVTNRSIR